MPTEAIGPPPAPTEEQKIENAVREKNYLKLVQKLLKISAEIGNLEKDGRNEAQNYSYITESAVKDAVRDKLVENKVLYFPYKSQILQTRKKESLDKYGKPRSGYITKMRITYKFIDTETGTFLDGFMDGEGADTHDKGPSKAVSGINKYIIMSHFLIATGDDPEKESKQAVRASNYGAPTPNATQPTNPPKTTTSQDSVDVKCDKCQALMAKKDGKYGPFWGCTNYPGCSRIVNENQLAGYLKLQNQEANIREEFIPENLPVPAPPDYQQPHETPDLPL